MGIGWEANAIGVVVPNYDDPNAPDKFAHQFAGVNSSHSHSSESQLELLTKVLKSCIFYLNELHEIEGEAAVSLGKAIRNLYRQVSDHANDQRLLAEMMQKLKDLEWARELGRQEYAKKTMEELREIAVRVNQDKWAAAGGREQFEALPNHVQEQREAAAAKVYIVEAGKRACDKLQPGDRMFLEVTVWIWARVAAVRLGLVLGA
jgi:hypothetical protein